MSELTRRRLIQSGLVAAASVSFGPAFWRDAFAAPPTVVGPGPYGPLLPPDANGLMLPPGFASRVVARGGQVMPGRGYVFPALPDGQAAFAMPDGGWVLATNSEIVVPPLNGGVSAIRFNAAGTVVDAYRILGGTTQNCAGGPTPWGTWLSCEEISTGQVWECDPTGNKAAVARPLLGWFAHEACCVDPVGEDVYLSEDFDGGCFYRFVPVDYPDLSAGTLEVACPGLAPGTVEWKPVPQPNPVLGGTPTRDQVPGALTFRRGEGMWFDSGLVYLVTTADHKIHVYDTATGGLSVLYDEASVVGAPLRDPDNIHVSPRSGDVFVSEDNGGADPMDVCIIAPDGQIARFLKMTGTDHNGSEVIGLTFDPSGTRFYAGSQRYGGTGVVYEITGPFRPYIPPPAPSQPPPPKPLAPIVIGLTIASRISIATLIRRGLAIALTLDKASTVRFRLTARITTKGRRRTVTLASATRKPGAGASNLRLKPTRAGARILRGRRRQTTATLTVRITTPGAPVRTLRRSVRLRP